MNTLSVVLEVLKVCHEAFPTGVERHSLTYNKETGNIELTIFTKGKWYSFVPGSRDLENIHAGIEFMKKHINETDL